jgi:uncharacterized Tic20 family protein
MPTIQERAKAWYGKLRKRLKTKAFKDAIAEVFFTIGTATLPVWFFPFLAAFLVGSTYALHLLDHSVSNGELLLLSTSLVGPLLFMLFRVYEDPTAEGQHRFKYRLSLVFPHAKLFGAVVFFICITSAAIFGLQKINPSFAGETLNKSGYVFISLLLFAISVIAFLIATMLRNELESYSPSKAMRHDEDDFAKRYEQEEPHI